MTEERTKSFSVDDGQSGERLDRFLTGCFADQSRTRIQEWIRAGQVRVNDAVEPSRYRVEPGDRILVTVPEAPSTELLPHELPLEIVYEDEDILVINKEAGLQVHPGAGTERTTLAHGLLFRYRGRNLPGAVDRPGIVHRLDRETSGLMVVALSDRGFLHLGEQIRQHSAERRYLALAWGQFGAKEGTVDAPIGRDARDRRKMAVRKAGREAITHWKVLSRWEHLTLLEIRLETGRTHQIRVHLGFLGHPIFGDPVYGRDKVWLDRIPGPEKSPLQHVLRRLNRQALHAYHLGFDRPKDGARVRFESPVPKDIETALLQLSERGTTG